MNLQNLDWSLWRSFLAILREGSLAGAARALDVAHPTVRRHLDELEAGLGAPLFVRSPSGLVATELALGLKEAAQTMESAAALLVRTASADAGAVAGAVRIAASEIIGVEVLPPILSALKARHPGLSFELSLSNSLEDLLRRDADIAVRMTRPAQDGLVARMVGRIPLGLFANESWIMRHGEPESVAALIASGALIGYDRNPAIIQALRALEMKATRTDFGFRSDSDLAQLSALRAGLGVGVCQLPIAARDAKLRRVLPDFTHALEIWLVTHPNLRNMRRVRATLDGLASGLAAHFPDPPVAARSSSVQRLR
jgi:DNA-binding transcriptional LysR family regulator